MKKYQQDQTQFATEKPLFEDIGSYPEPEFQDIKEKTPLLKRRKVVIGLVVLFTILVLIILLLVNTYIQQRKLVTVPDPSPTITRKQVELEPLLKRIEDAERELKEADPTKNELGYPALDYDIRLDSKKRR